MQIGRLSSAREPCQILEILPALLGAPVVAGLIFGAYQAVGSASTIGRRIEVAPGPPNALLNMAPDGFDSLEDPGLALRVRKEADQLGTVLTVAGECTRALPIGRR
jgi:hypothetical protein